MMHSASALFLVVGLIAATPSTSAYTVAEVAAGITNAIHTGSPLWNHGNKEGCTAIYMATCEKYAALDERLGAATITAAKQSAHHAGWTLRGAMDAVLHTIHAGQPLITPVFLNELEEEKMSMSMMLTSTYSLDEVAAGINKAIHTGSPLWNRGDIEACTAIYMATCEMYAHMDDRLQDAVEHAERQTAHDAGWTLRHGMDAVLRTIHAGGQLSATTAITTNSSSSDNNGWWTGSSSWGSWGSDAASTYESCTTCNDDAAPNYRQFRRDRNKALLWSGVGLIALGMIMVVAIKTPSLWRSGRDQQVHQDDGQQQQQQQGARGEEAMVGMTLHSLTSNSDASANSNADGNNDPAPRYDQRTLELSPPSYEAAAASGPRTTTKGPSSVLTV